MKRFLVIPVLVIMLTLSGCPKKYHSAVQAAKDLADAVSILQKTAHDVHARGLTTNEEDIRIQIIIQKMSTDGAALTAAVVHFKGAKGVKANADVVLDDTSQLLNDNVLPVKNPEARTAIQSGVLAVRGLLDTIYLAGE